jgi:hypothetical protein
VLVDYDVDSTIFGCEAVRAVVVSDHHDRDDDDDDDDDDGVDGQKLIYPDGLLA